MLMPFSVMPSALPVSVSFSVFVGACVVVCVETKLGAVRCVCVCVCVCTGVLLPPSLPPSALPTPSIPPGPMRVPLRQRYITDLAVCPLYWPRSGQARRTHGNDGRGAHHPHPLRRCRGHVVRVSHGDARSGGWKAGEFAPPRVASLLIPVKTDRFSLIPSRVRTEHDLARWASAKPTAPQLGPLPKPQIGTH